MTQDGAERDESIRPKFARRRRRQVVVLIALGLLANAYVLWLVGVFTDAQFLAWGPWFAVGATCAYVAHFCNWRCPKCEKPPGWFRARYCQSCGVNLR